MKTKKLINFIKRILTYPERARRAAVDAGLCDYSGQGRDKYGK